MSGIGNILGGVAQATIGAQAADSAGREGYNGAQNAMNQANSVYGTNSANFNPYIQSGNQANQMLQAGMGQNGSLGHAFTQSDFNADPAFNFDMSQGLKAISNSQSVRGGALSGGTQKALVNYGQQQASNEYQNAYNRFTANQNQNYNQLNGIAGRGLQATQGLGALGNEYSNANTAEMNNQTNATMGATLGKAAAEIGGAQKVATGMASMVS